VISGPYTKGSVKMAKRRVSSRLAINEIATHGYRVLTFVKCTTIMIVELVWSYLGVEWLAMVFGVAV
jgi:hypothetical protein